MISQTRPTPSRVPTLTSGGLLVSVGAVLGLLGVLFAALTALTLWLSWPLWLAISIGTLAVLALLAGLTIGGLGAHLARNGVLLLVRGKQATATVTEHWLDDHPHAPCHYLTVEFEAIDHAGVTHTITAAQRLSQHHCEQFAPGMPILVRYDPHNVRRFRLMPIPR